MTVMVKARYYKADGKKGRARALPETLFDGVVNDSALHQVVKVYLANQRQGTGSAKNRSAVRGGSRKPWRQKGTGRARQGTIRAPQWTGGGLAFPPQPHSWRQRVPRKVRGLARRSALNARAQDDRVVLIDALDFDKPATRQLVKYLASIEVEGKALILTDGIKENVVLSARNVPGLEVRPFGQESPYDILYASIVVIERSALEALEADGDEAAAAEASAEAAAPKKKTAPKKKAAPKKNAAAETGRASGKKKAASAETAEAAPAEDGEAEGEEPSAQAAAEDTGDERKEETDA
jgi:large subunit ribosomal protein L4